jgi:hypothetical protein
MPIRIKLNGINSIAKNIYIIETVSIPKSAEGALSKIGIAIAIAARSLLNNKKPIISGIELM